MTEPSQRQRVRSFVRRGGRITRAQARALTELWPRFGACARDLAEPDRVFGRQAPRFLEIGFGMGDALAEMAAAHPERDYIGVDVHEAGIGRALLLLARRGLSNVRIVRADAMVLLREFVPAACLDAILVYFPDPWPKKRHHKRRLVQAEFVELAARALRAGGLLQLATDWAPYAEQMLEVIEADARFSNLAGSGRYAPDAGERPPTKFERRGERLGHGIFDLRFRRAGAR